MDILFYSNNSTSWSVWVGHSSASSQRLKSSMANASSRARSDKSPEDGAQ
jgi:hypothetical protein